MSTIEATKQHSLKLVKPVKLVNQVKLVNYFNSKISEPIETFELLNFNIETSEPSETSEPK